MAGAVFGSLPGTVVAVTHDRYFLDNAAEWILELDRGHGIPWKGNYSSWLEQKEARLAQESKSEAARIKAMKQELEWVRQNAKGRQAKSKARLARFEEMSNYEYQKRNETQEIFIPVAERLGNEVIEFTNVSKAFGDKLLIDDLSFKVPAGAIVGIIGPNGARQIHAVQNDFRQRAARFRRSEHRPNRENVAYRPNPEGLGNDKTVLTKSPKAAIFASGSISKFPPAPTSAASTSKAAIRAKSWATFPAASAAACTWPNPCSPAATCCCLMSLPTI